jgi:hypothetical protein
MRPAGVGSFDSGRTVVGRIHLEALVRQTTLEQRHELVVIVHQEYPGHGASTPFLPAIVVV